MRAANFAFSPDRPSSCTSTDCIWFLCRRTVRYILMYATNVSMKAKASVNEMRKSRVTRDSHKIIKETNALNTQMKITTTTTRLWVTTSWYLRWSWTAKNLSTLTATTPRKEIVENTEPEIFMIRWALQPGLFNCNHLTRSDVWNGWANKSTPKSEKAKLKSRVFLSFFHCRSFLKGRPSMSKIKLFQRSTVKNLILKFLCLITRMSPTRMIFLEGLSTNNRFIYFEWYRRQGDEASVGSTQRHVIAFIIFFGNF